MNDYEKNSAQKLAETLKRCGLASSVSQAHMMAGSITSTEKKVQTFFDQKKKEMKDDLMMSVHPHREDMNHEKESPMLKQAKETVAFSLEKKEEAKAEEQPSPKVEVYYEHHDEIIKKEENAPLKEEPKIMVITSDHHDEILSSAQPLKEVMNEESGKNEDYINKYISQEESKTAVEKEEMKQEIKAEPAKVEAPKSSLPPKPTYQSSTMGPHPKTGSSYGVSLESYFNYGKRAK